MIWIVLLAAATSTVSALQSRSDDVMLDSDFSAASMSYEELVDANDFTAEVQRPSGSLILHQSMKNRPGMLELVQHAAGSTIRSMDPQAETGHTVVEDTEAKAWFGAFVVIMAAAMFGIVKFAQTKAFLEMESIEDMAGSRDALNAEEYDSRLKYINYVKGVSCYNIACPLFVFVSCFMMFFATIGGINNQNLMVASGGATTQTQPGFEGTWIQLAHTANAGERAFFAGMGMMFQMVLGAFFVLWLRKAANLQIRTAQLCAYAMRGGFIGMVAICFIEIMHLPFQDAMKSDASYAPRIFLVLFMVGVFAVIAEIAKLSMVVAGLKQDRTEGQEEGFNWCVEQVMKVFRGVIESPQGVALCGLCTGLGYAFIENIPRFLAVAMEPPMETKSANMTEKDQRQVRVWTFIFWAVFNIQPWLTGIAALRFALKSAKGPLDVKDWMSVLSQVVVLHAGFDLLDRSSSSVIEFIGCCAIPYAINRFRKEWNATGGQTEGFDAMFDDEEEQSEEVRV